jgi:mannose-6-phosphate isomerase
MIDKEALYPMLFDPIYREVVWGGNLLSSHLGRKPPKTEIPVGEAWELADRDDAVSVIANGPLRGTPLNVLLAEHGRSVGGDRYRGGRFPLLIKFIDAGKRLSLQVHPDAAAAAELGDGAEPKTEMWYIVAVKPGAKIMAGMRASCTRRKFVDSLHSTEIEDCMQTFPAVPGDAYFINAGCIHAIGAGTLLLEVQQNSDTTYRVSDWGRLGADGKPRALHVDQAMASINFTDRTNPRIVGVVDTAGHNRKFPIVNRCPFFKVDDLRLAEDWPDHTDSASFHLLTAINRPIHVLGREKECQVEVDTGRTCLIPANFGRYTIHLAEGAATVIRSSLS